MLPMRLARLGPQLLGSSRRLLQTAPRQPRLLRGLAGGSSDSGGTTLLAALVERSPQVTPELSDLEQIQHAHQRRLEGLHKAYPTALTAAEEGPDQQRARLRMEQLVEHESTREGEGDRTGDESSIDRRLDCRVYLAVRVNGHWQLPAEAWRSPESAREGLRRVLSAQCGDDLSAHQMGNAPLAHLALESGDTLFLWRHMYVSGEVEVRDGDAHAWLTKEELAERLGAQIGPLTATACGPFR